VNVSPWTSELGCNWTWSAPWNATSYHVFFMQKVVFMNENVPEMFWVTLLRCDWVIKNAL
jgi:hypothetical protein